MLPSSIHGRPCCCSGRDCSDVTQDVEKKDDDDDADEYDGDENDGDDGDADDDGYVYEYGCDDDGVEDGG